MVLTAARTAGAGSVCKASTGSHFVRRGDYRLMIRDSEPMRARDFV